MKLPFAANTNFNLIEFNDFNGFKGSDRLESFKEKLITKYKCFIRSSRGKDIKAACGMLGNDT